MTDKKLLAKLFKLLWQAKEAGYISSQERAIMYELAVRGTKIEQLSLELDITTRQRDVALEWIDQP